MNNEGGGEESRLEMFSRTLNPAPFSSLSRVGIRLFTWHQYDDYADYALAPNPPLETSAELSHYYAAVALFLIIEDRYGQRAIREIMQDVNKLKNGTGEDVKRIVSRVLGTDIVKLVEGFRFPYTGLSMGPVSGPHDASAGDRPKEGLWVVNATDNSPAQRAGITRGDVIVSLDGERTITNCDFEFALYKHMEQQSVKVGLWRTGAGYLTIEMSLGEEPLPRDIRGHHTNFLRLSSVALECRAEDFGPVARSVATETACLPYPGTPY